MHRQELSKIVNFVHFYEWAPIGDVCLMISKKVQHDHRPLRASFPPAIPLSKHPYPYLYLQICVSIVRSRTSLLSAKLIIGKSLPAQLLAPHMCEIKRKFHLGKTKNVSFFLSFRVLSSMYNAHMYMAGKWSLAGGKIPTTHKVHRQICIGKRIPKKNEAQPKGKLNATFPFSGSPLDSCQKSLANILSVRERKVCVFKGSQPTSTN